MLDFRIRIIYNEVTQPVIRAIGVSHTACKDEFRQHLRSHSWMECIFIFIIIYKIGIPSPWICLYCVIGFAILVFSKEITFFFQQRVPSLRKETPPRKKKKMALLHTARCFFFLLYNDCTKLSRPEASIPLNSNSPLQNSRRL